MGTDHSKRRKGHEHPEHLPKVGSPANREWERKTRIRQTFGTGPRIAVTVAVLLIALVGWLLITL